MKPWFCHSHGGAPVPLHFGTGLALRPRQPCPGQYLLQQRAAVTHSHHTLGQGRASVPTRPRMRPPAPRQAGQPAPSPAGIALSTFYPQRRAKEACETATYQHQWVGLARHQQADAPPAWPSFPQRRWWARGLPPLLLGPLDSYRRRQVRSSSQQRCLACTKGVVPSHSSPDARPGGQSQGHGLQPQTRLRCPGAAAGHKRSVGKLSQEPAGAPRAGGPFPPPQTLLARCPPEPQTTQTATRAHISHCATGPSPRWAHGVSSPFRLRKCCHEFRLECEQAQARGPSKPGTELGPTYTHLPRSARPCWLFLEHGLPVATIPIPCASGREPVRVSPRLGQDMPVPQGNATAAAV